MRKAIVAYVPVAHQGYINFFMRHPEADICVVSKNLIEEIDPKQAEILGRMLYAVDPAWIVDDLNMHLHPQFALLLDSLDDLSSYGKIIMPEDDISTLLKERLTGKKVVIESASLRYDWSKASAVKTVEPDAEVTEDELHRRFIEQASEIAHKSTDWWRQVGVVVRCADGTILTGYNEHMPHPQLVNIIGDPRSSLSPGELPDVCTAIHGEGSVIAQAARQKGVSTDGADMYLTTFPCPVCARFIGKAGIKTLYYKEGYSRLDAKEILKASGVKIVKVI